MAEAALSRDKPRCYRRGACFGALIARRARLASAEQVVVVLVERGREAVRLVLLRGRHRRAGDAVEVDRVEQCLRGVDRGDCGGTGPGLATTFSFAARSCAARLKPGSLDFLVPLLIVDLSRIRMAFRQSPAWRTRSPISDAGWLRQPPASGRAPAFGSPLRLGARCPVLPEADRQRTTPRRRRVVDRKLLRLPGRP